MIDSSTSVQCTMDSANSRSIADRLASNFHVLKNLSISPRSAVPFDESLGLFDHCGSTVAQQPPVHRLLARASLDFARRHRWRITWAERNAPEPHFLAHHAGPTLGASSEGDSLLADQPR